MRDETPPNERFGVMAAEARRNGSANLKVCTPQEVQWKPPLRQAAIPLGASGGQRQRKRLIANASNRSERAEQKMTVQSSFCKGAKRVPKLKGKTCEAVRAGLKIF